MNSKKIIDICDLFVDFNKNIESLFPLIQLNGKSAEIKRLPTFNIPQDIRNIEPNLKYQPIYRLEFENSDINVLLGDHTIGFDLSKSTNEDVNFIIDILESIKNEIHSINRIGTKKTFFTTTIENFLSIKIKNNDYLKSLSNIKIKKEYGENICFIMIADNKSNILTLDNEYKEENGYFIEIITAYEKPNSNYDNTICKKIKELHSLQNEKMKEIIP
ncbi:TPA: hypothetical protein ACRZSW_001424 [Campylobacter lari subsp. concheus]|uniref:hypothetical protein n=1 Tax=Campylobacter TaxID=194 RepID=UPI000B3F779C|nr:MULTISPECIES: hypothetical protein [Campylobacter]EAJ6151657.1 hypothetical protein [Campylobacter lari]MBT0828269.1 hypothetical protein [Campylobacter lari]MCV3552453.1 hypothetical protein [Campylobacter sp. CNRCH_2013_0855]